MTKMGPTPCCSETTDWILDVPTGRIIAAGAEHTDFVYSVAFSPDGKRLVSVGRDAAKVWSAPELLKRKVK